MKILILLFIIPIFLYPQSVVVNRKSSERDRYIKAYLSKNKFRYDKKDIKKYIQYLETNLVNFITSKKFENEILTYKKEHNFVNMRYLSDYLMILAKKNKILQVPKNRLYLCNVISKISPNYNIGDYCYGDHYFKKSKLAIWNYIPYYINGFKKGLKNGSFFDLPYYHISLIFLLIFYILILIPIFQNLPLFLFDCYSLLNIKLTKFESILSLLSLLLIPIIIFKPTLLSIFIILASISIAYYKKRFLIIVLIIILTPFLIYKIQEYYQNNKIDYSSISWIAYQSIIDDFPKNSGDQLIFKDNNSILSHLAMAKWDKSDKNFISAINRYKILLKKSKESIFLNNLAILEVFSQNDAKAIEHFKEAINISPKNPLYYYNLSKYYYRTGSKIEGDNFRKIAKDLNRNMVEKWDKDSSFHYQNFFLDSYENLRKYIKQISINKIKIDKVMNSYFIPYKKDRYLSIIVSVIFLTLIIKLIFKQKLNGKYCSKCGTIFNYFDQPTKNSNLCEGCYHILNSRDTLDPKALLNKEQNIRKYRRLNHYKNIAINIFIPGAYNLYRDKKIYGIFFIIYHLIFISVLILSKSWLRNGLNKNFGLTILFFISIFELFIYIYSFIKIGKNRI